MCTYARLSVETISEEVVAVECCSLTVMLNNACDGRMQMYHCDSGAVSRHTVTALYGTLGHRIIPSSSSHIPSSPSSSDQSSASTAAADRESRSADPPPCCC